MGTPAAEPPLRKAPPVRPLQGRGSVGCPLRATVSSFPLAIFLHPDIAAVISHTRDRWWRLPDFVRARRRAQRNAYMRGYMRAYRQSAHSVNASLSDEEHRRLEREAKALGRKPTTCFREAAFAYFDRRTLLPKSYEENLADAIGEIRRVGNNLNQLAHHANTRRRATHREVQEARRHLADLEAEVARRLLPLPLPAAAPDGSPSL